MVDNKPVVVEEISKQIIVDQANILPANGLLGGTALTGFIDIEKLIHIKNCEKPLTLFLEKKLPFSVVVLSLDTH
jgi:hypothetical protein